MTLPDNFIFLDAMVDPTKKFVYVHIAKNASSKIMSVLRKEGWVGIDGMFLEDVPAYLEDKKIFCILREPYQRYLTGFVNYLGSVECLDYDELIGYSLRKLLRYNNKSNFDVLRLAFNYGKFDFDVHTRLQVKSLGNLDTSKIDFFYLNDKLGVQLNKYFQSHNTLIPFNNAKINPRPDDNFHKVLLTNFFEKEEHIMFKENLLNYLKPDYDLINSIKFYNV